MTYSEVDMCRLLGGGVVYQGHLCSVFAKDGDDAFVLIGLMDGGKKHYGVKPSELVKENDYDWGNGNQ